MPNTITIDFIPCIPPPAAGFSVRYKIVGDPDFTEVGPFTENPIVFEAPGEPGTCYEGALFSDCGGGKIGDYMNWVACAEPAPAESESESPEPPVTGQLIVTSTDPDLSIVGLVNVNNSGISYPVTATVQFGTWNNFFGGNIQVNLSAQADGFCRLLKNGIQLDIQPFTEFQGFVTFTAVAAYVGGDIMEINVQLT